MKPVLYLSVFFLACLHTPALAQKTINGSVKGKVVDSARKESLAEATVTILNPKDSSIVSYTLAKAGGVFEIKDLTPGLYRLLVSFQGYETYAKNFMIAAEFPDINLQNIYLDRKGTVLQAVVVEGPPIQVKKDTVEFRASAFAVKPNAYAEDVLKKMPGVQIDKDGNIKAQGEDVQKVYVDGKEFFGSDPKMATKNITADMIESIQVFDDMSDQAKFTRIDDGSRSKTINIKLKKDKKVGSFGRLVAGGATDNRYESSLTFNRFKGDKRFSVLAGSNNLNKQAFSFSDIVSAMGGFGSRSGGGTGGGAGFGGGGGGNRMMIAGPMGGNTGNGINRNTSAGFNYVNKFSNKLDVTGSYFFSQGNNRNEKSSLRNTFFPNDSASLQSTQTFSSSLNQNHRANLRMEYFIDSNNSLLYTPSLTVQHSESRSFDTTFTFAQNPQVNYLAIDGITRNTNEREGLNLNNNLLYRHKFGKLGRTFTIGVNHSLNRSDGNGTSLAPLTFYNADGTVNRVRRQDLITEQATRSNNKTLSSSYTEPLGNNKLLEFNYAYTNNYNTSDKKAWDFNTGSGKYDQLNVLQTNYFENAFLSHRAGLNFRVQTTKYNYQFGGAIQQSVLDNRSVRAATGKDTTIRQRFINFFPTANYQYNWSKSKNLRLRYNGRTNQPTANQLQDVRDVSNPLQIVTGNPALKQEFSNNVNLNYSTFNTGSFGFLNINLNAGNTYNKIVNSIDTDPFQKGAQLIRPVNLDGALNASSYITLGLPLKGKLKGSNFNFNNFIRYNRDVSLLYQQKNITNNLSISQTVNVNLDIKKVVNLWINASLTYNQVDYSVVTAASQNQKYYTQTYSTDFSYLGFKNWVLNTDFDYTINTGLGAGYDQAIPLWNASISHQVFKKRNGEFKFSVKDLLNQNQAIGRNVGDNYVEDTRSLVLRRYFLLTFTYNLNKGQRPQGGPPNMSPGMERRMQRAIILQ